MIEKKQKVILIGHIDGFGGSQTAFKKLVEFIENEKYITRIIPITDNCKKDEWLLKNKHLLLTHIPYVTNSYYLKLKKVLKIFLSITLIKVSKPDFFITVGLNNSSNTIARFLNKTTFKIAQDFNADRLPDDILWHKSQKNYDGLALQAPSMLAYWQHNSPSSHNLNWLPCFPSPPFDNIATRGSLNNNILSVVYFGRLAGNKGLDLLINSISNITHKVSLDIWGTGEEELPLKKLVEQLHLNEVVKFKGKYPSGIESARLMSSYDLLALCSTKTEGLPLTLLEAMAYGLPLLVTDVGAIKDCCTNNQDTILVQPNLLAIKEGLIKACQMHSNKQFDGLRQQLYYQRNFSFEVMANRWKECLNEQYAFFK